MRMNVLPAILLLSIVLVLGGVCPAAAQFYLQHNLVSDGAVPAGLTDTRVVNSPWGLARAPADFGRFSNHLLVGNFGNGRIHAFDPAHLTGQGEFQNRGPLHSADGPPIAIDGLWALSFGQGANNNANGLTNTLFFTAGPFDESHGLLGSLVAVPPPGRQ